MPPKAPHSTIDLKMNPLDVAMDDLATRVENLPSVLGGLEHGHEVHTPLGQ